MLLKQIEIDGKKVFKFFNADDLKEIDGLVFNSPLEAFNHYNL